MALTPEDNELAFEETSSGNPHGITKKQHYHLNAIIKKFAGSNGIIRTLKNCGTTERVSSENKCFLGMRAWSQEGETAVSHPIENSFLDEVKIAEQMKGIKNHKSISNYHLLWLLRFHYAKNETDDYQLYSGVSFGSMDKTFEELIESHGKVPVQRDGKIAGRFKKTLDIKDLLQENEKAYTGVKWQVLVSNDLKLISADCYKESLYFPISPQIALKGIKDEPFTPIEIVSKEDAQKLNDHSINKAVDFYFGV